MGARAQARSKPFDVATITIWAAGAILPWAVILIAWRALTIAFG
jgi:hypothetical protein